MRREVTSPGGSTARGLDALERNNLRTAFSDALDAVLDGSAVIVLATAREDIASFVSALILVYTILIFVYILTNLLFAFGGKVPYNRWADGLLTFLRDVCEPYLRIFRKVIPQFGPFDFSPIVAVLVLQIVGGIIVNVIRG